MNMQSIKDSSILPNTNALKTGAFSPEELAHIKANYVNMSVTELSNSMNRGEGSVRNKIHTMGLKKLKSNKKLVNVLKKANNRLTDNKATVVNRAKRDSIQIDITGKDIRSVLQIVRYLDAGKLTYQI